MSDKIELFPKKVPYSSIVGSSITLTDTSGRAAFMVMFCGTTTGITKEESLALRDQISALIEEHGISVPAREATP